MKTAVDTNIFFALWAKQPASARAHALLREAGVSGAVTICGVVYAELMAYPGASRDFVGRFMNGAAVQVDLSFSRNALADAGRAYRQYAARRRKAGGGSARRLLADFLVGAHATDHADRLLNFDPGDFRPDFPHLVIVP